MSGRRCVCSHGTESCHAISTLHPIDTHHRTERLCSEYTDQKLGMIRAGRTQGLHQWARAALRFSCPEGILHHEPNDSTVLSPGVV